MMQDVVVLSRMVIETTLAQSGGGASLTTASWYALLSIMLLLDSSDERHLVRICDVLRRTLGGTRNNASDDVGIKSMFRDHPYDAGECLMSLIISREDVRKQKTMDSSGGGGGSESDHIESTGDIVMDAVTAALRREQLRAADARIEHQSEASSVSAAASEVRRLVLEALLRNDRLEWTVALLCDVGRSAITQSDAAALLLAAKSTDVMSGPMTAKLSLALGRHSRTALRDIADYDIAVVDQQLIALTLSFGNFRVTTDTDDRRVAKFFALLVKEVRRASELPHTPFVISLQHLVARLLLAGDVASAATVVMQAKRVHVRLRTESASLHVLRAFLSGYANQDEEAYALSSTVCSAAVSVLRK
jgi:hypothetical protein